MSHASIHLPVLFEVSGNTMVIGEKPLTETSYYNYRHQFTCGGGTANTTSTLLKNQFNSSRIFCSLVSFVPSVPLLLSVPSVACKS